MMFHAADVPSGVDADAGRALPPPQDRSVDPIPFQSESGNRPAGFPHGSNLPSAPTPPSVVLLVPGQPVLAQPPLPPLTARPITPSMSRPIGPRLGQAPSAFERLPVPDRRRVASPRAVQPQRLRN